MRIWKRGIIGVASAAVIATGAIAAFAANGTQPAPQRTTSVDVKGPCDEAEHANDANCDGAQVREDRPGAGIDAVNDDGPNHDANDDKGAEGEHSDPSDSSGSGSGGEDHSGSDNSGPGSSSSGSGSSGGDD
jgi:hypothetical protein